MQDGYKKLLTDGRDDRVVLRISDMASVPLTDPNNYDFQVYKAWLERGNQPLPADNSEQ